MKTARMLELFAQLKAYMETQGLTELVYKCIPHIYHGCPAEEDIYALCLQQAQLIRCDVTTAIDMRNPLPFSDRRMRGIGKAKKAGITVSASNDYAVFHALLETRLREKYDSTPTHSLEELSLLAGRFPGNILLFIASREAMMLAGVVMYVSEHVAHVQYIASNEEGRDSGALDMVFDHLVHQVYSDKRVFDFGTSAGKQEHSLSEGLMEQKEEFGARAVMQYTYRMQRKASES